MMSWRTWLQVIAALAAAFVAISAVALAIRLRSWQPIAAVGWIPAVIVVAWSGYGRSCWPRRRAAAR